MPIASPSRRRTRAQSAWNVPAWTSRPGSPTRLMIRSRSSAAAWFVKVTARIRHGATPLTPTRYAIRWARTRVLPEPAPARIRSGPSVVVTARACSGLSGRRSRRPGGGLGRRGGVGRGLAFAALLGGQLDRRLRRGIGRLAQPVGLGRGGVEEHLGGVGEQRSLAGRRLVEESSGAGPAGRGGHRLIVGRRPSPGLSGIPSAAPNVADRAVLWCGINRRRNDGPSDASSRVLGHRLLRSADNSGRLRAANWVPEQVRASDRLLCPRATREARKLRDPGRRGPGSRRNVRWAAAGTPQRLTGRSGPPAGPRP